jgi:HemY protein
MRTVLWLAALFAIAVASALFASNNQGTVTVYWPPYRVDMSINLVVVLLVGGFLALHLGLRALAVLFDIPRLARRWRLLQKERAIQTQLLDALSHFIGGRFVRARKGAEQVVSLEKMMTNGGEQLGYAQRLRTIAHLLAAESAHSLQDSVVRDQHFQLALDSATGRSAQEMRDGLLLRAARWALNDRDARTALQWLDRLPQGVARRTLALRLRFKAARLAGHSRVALETARLLSKHRAFSGETGKSIIQGLAIEWVRTSHDQGQMQHVWDTLDSAARQLPEVVLEAAERLVAVAGDPELSRQWLLPVWDAMVQEQSTFPQALRVRLIKVLTQTFSSGAATPDAIWLARIEFAQKANPREALLQYLAGVVCMRIGLWGKAQQMIKQSMTLLKDPELKRDGWLAIAILAEQRQDTDGANLAYREAAKR